MVDKSDKGTIGTGRLGICPVGGRAPVQAASRPGG